MPKTNANAYDVVIIGAGISGLVCGCYLAKAGMKVLIAEQHSKPGGYCTSFKRQGFTFDAAAHSFGGYRNDGIVRKVFNELAIDKRIIIKRYNPSDTIITRDHQVSFWADSEKTIEEFSKYFPDETNNIKNFINFINHAEPLAYAQIRRLSFDNLLDKFFRNDKLKAILSFPLYGNGGLPPSLMSAYMGATIFTEFLLDGGYYPEEGMQAIPDGLVGRFKELGGELRLSTLIRKIGTDGNKVTGVYLEKDGFVSSKYVVANCDTRQTFFDLLGGKNMTRDVSAKLKSMTPSLSMFILYLGVDKKLETSLPSSLNVWRLSEYDLDKVYAESKLENPDSLGGYLIHISPCRKCILIYKNVAFNSKKYWNENRVKLSEYFLKRLEAEAFPRLKEHIVFMASATPSTLNRYTLNYKGAAYGWAATPTQLGDLGFQKPSFMQNLYLTGHWTTQGFGIPGVTYIGRNTAKVIIGRSSLS